MVVVVLLLLCQLLPLSRSIGGQVPLRSAGRWLKPVVAAVPLGRLLDPPREPDGLARVWVVEEQSAIAPRGVTFPACGGGYGGGMWGVRG